MQSRKLTHACTQARTQVTQTLVFPLWQLESPSQRRSLFPRSFLWKTTPSRHDACAGGCGARADLCCTPQCEAAAEASLSVYHQSGVLVSLPVAESKNTFPVWIIHLIAGLCSINSQYWTGPALPGDWLSIVKLQMLLFVLSQKWEN